MTANIKTFRDLTLHGLKTKRCQDEDSYNGRKSNPGPDQVENVDQFSCLGSMITKDNHCSHDIKRSLSLGQGPFSGFHTVWQVKDISLQTKLHILHSCVFSALLYDTVFRPARIN